MKPSLSGLLRMLFPITLSSFFLLATLFSCGPDNSEEKKSEPLNILFIMTDDHAYQALSAYSDRLTTTPNIDRIAKEGMLFTNACVTNSICAPSRAVILTGKHCHINGKIDNRSPFDTTQVTFPQIMQKAGYQTALFGKLHFGNSPKGFDQFKILPGQGRYYNPDFITKNKGRIIVEGYTTDIITDMTIDWMKEERDPNKPFLLMYLHKAPHRSWLPAKRHYKEFTKREFPEPTTLFDDYEGRGTAAKTAEMNILKHMTWSKDTKVDPEVIREFGIEEAQADTTSFHYRIGAMNDSQRESWDSVYRPINTKFKEAYPNMTEKQKMKWKYQRYMQDYLACIAAVDEGVGKMLDYLEETGLDKNTMVIYTSDQGFYLGEHGWFDKRFIYDESFKTPLLIKWPGVIKEGSVNDEMVQNLDYAQTILDATKIPAPNDMQGESLVPLLNGENENWTRDAVYYHYYEYPAVHMVKRHYGIVTKDYKLAHFYYDVDEWELYDRKKDSLEMKNVYDDPAYSNIVAAMKKRLYALREYYKDPKELDQKYIESYMNK